MVASKWGQPNYNESITSNNVNKEVFKKTREDTKAGVTGSRSTPVLRVHLHVSTAKAQAKVASLSLQ